MAETRRLFFALWPSRPTAVTIAERVGHGAVAGKRVPAERLHLTLAFLGGVPEASVPALLEAAVGVRAAAFELVLSRLGCFPRAGVAWLGPATAPAPLADLAAGVRSAADAANLPAQNHRFRPHVTVARGASIAHPRQLEPVVWPVTGYSLTESVPTGGRVVYRDLANWRLSRCRG